MPYIDDVEPEQYEDERVSIATEVVDGLSVAPTEMLANEYKRLME